MSKLKASSTVTANPTATTLNKPSFSSLKSTSQLQLQQQQSQLTKKRSALGNISNATGGGTINANLTSFSNGSNNNSASSNKEVSKKSRFGIQSDQTNLLTSTNASSTLPICTGSQITKKSTDSILTNNKKASFLSKETVSSKENFTNLLPCSFLNIKKKANEQKSQQQQHVQRASVSLSTSSNGSSVKLDKTELNEIKQEAILKLEQRIRKAENGLSDSQMCSEELEEKDDEEEVLLEEKKEQKEEDWEDIDANDNDEFNTNDYVNCIFKYYNEREDMFIIKDYIKEQPHINKQMRLLLVDWMVEVQQQLEFNHEVLYLSVKLLDLYLNGRKVEKEKLQLLGGAAMFIACKFEERMPPVIDDFIFVSDNAYNRKELIKMEIDILKSVRFDIGIPLSYTFLRRYAKCVKADMKFLTLARYILELSLQDYSFVYLKDSLKACAALYLALKMTVSHEKNYKSASLVDNKQNANQLTVSSSNLSSTEWNSTLIHYTGCNVEQFVHILPSMNNLIQLAPTSKYRTIYRKYSHSVFYEVAKVLPLEQNELDSLVKQYSPSLSSQ